MSRNRTFAVGAALVVIVALLFSLPAVRAAASDFLGLFRVQKFAPISVSPEQMALLEHLGEQGFRPGEFVTVKEASEPEAVGSVEDAEALTGYDVRQLGRARPAEVYVSDSAQGYLTVDLAGARAIVEAAGVDPMLLPDSLDGARVDVTVYDSVQQLYYDGQKLMQTPSPDVTYPDDVDPVVLGEALLQVLGTEPAEARRIAETIDWTSTLLLPVPQDMATYREVTIKGASGVALQPLNPEADPAVMWQRDGMVYMLTGPFTLDELVQDANTLR